MAHININGIEYIYSTFYTDLFDTQDELAFIKVTFDFAYIKDCKLTISTNEIKEISDYEIKKHILKCMNLILERKFIDEI